LINPKAKMDAELEKRCHELIERGKAWASGIKRYKGSPNYWFPADEVAGLQAWIASVGNLFRIVSTPDTYFHQECTRILEDEHLRSGVPYLVVLKLIGLLESLVEEIQQGLLKKAEYIFAASTFDDFLDHASEYHKSGKKVESSVLASAVFEDSVRKVAMKYDVKESGRALEMIIDELVKKNILTAVKAKRLKGYAAVRKKALHAQWNDFDLRDVGGMIQGSREILESIL
jgi:uncharacterized protein YutE (UPF0331/DUF86 family)